MLIRARAGSMVGFANAKPAHEDQDREEQRQGINDRLALAEAWLLAVSRRDEVLRIIGDADDVDAARERLHALLGVDAMGANAILDLQFRRLPALERAKILQYRDELLRQRDLLGEEGI